MQHQKLPDPQWLESLFKKLKALVLKGDYKAALPIARGALKKWPTHFEIRYHYAKLLGDWADELPVQRKRKAKAEAIRILRPLLRALGGKPAVLRFGVCLNYYYQSENFLGMVRFGRKLSERKDRQGFYAAGVGASHVSFRLLGLGKAAQSRAWARKALSFWQRYRLIGEKYYFPFYCEAMAYAVAGDKKSALASLKTAARISQRTIRDWEFHDVLSLIEKS